MLAEKKISLQVYFFLVGSTSRQNLTLNCCENYKIPMASRKKGTGQPLLEHEKLAIVSVKMKRGYKYQNGSQLRQ
jgi:hypothetical protein